MSDVTHPEIAVRLMQTITRLEARLEKQSEALKQLCHVVGEIAKTVEDMATLIFVEQEPTPQADPDKCLMVLGPRESRLWQEESEAAQALRTTLYQMALAHAGELGKPVEIYTFDNKLLARVEQEVTH